MSKKYIKKLSQLLSLTLFIILSVSLIASLFFKEQWLWLDEVLSYLLVTDPSITHMNDAVVSGMDANPPLFVNVYWLIGHSISLNPLFLRAVSVVIFASTITLFYRYTLTLIGSPIANFVLITLLVAFTYLNLTLSTQIRTYALFLFIGLGYFVALQQLISQPDQAKLLIRLCLLGILLVFTHNFGLFYLAASGAFFAVLWLWSRQRQYVLVLGAHALIGVVWLLMWYPNFAIQTQAGKPHSWIPLPTLSSFFHMAGELYPTLSSNLEHRPLFIFLPILRFLVVLGLLIYLALPRLRTPFKSLQTDTAFMFYLMAGWIYLTTLGIALLVSLVHTSVWISRYLWPSHLLLVYQFMYAWFVLSKGWLTRVILPRWSLRLLPIYMLALGVFLFFQNRKVVVFPSGILSYLPPLDKRYPVFAESADYFLPLWLHAKGTNMRYVLDWETALHEGNMLNATVEHKILKSVREKYGLTGILPAVDFNPKSVPHFYVIDEQSQYQFEQFIATGRVQIIRQLPIALSGHRLLECTFKEGNSTN